MNSQNEIKFQKRPFIGLGVLLFDEHKNLLLGKRKASHGESTWCPPGGHVEFGESFEYCAMRETLEETGLVINNPQFFCITNDLFHTEQKHYVSVFMKAEI